MRRSGRLAAHHFEALGTSCSLFAVGLPHERLVEGEAWTRRLGGRLTRFSPDSELSAFNSSAGRWIEISQELEALLRESVRAFESSGGLVNVAVLPSMIGIGYTQPLSSGRPAATLTELRPPALPDVLQVRPGAARVKLRAGVDLGGNAKAGMAE